MIVPWGKIVRIDKSDDLIEIKIIIANLPSPDHVADLPDDEPVQPEPAPIILHHAPAQPEGYVGDDDMEEDEEEDPDEDPEEDQLSKLFLNKTIWMEEDRVDDDDEEMDEDDEDSGGNDNEDKAEVINAYKEVDPLNRPPSTSNEETEFTPPVVPIADVNDEPVPPVIQFGHNFHVGESSSTGTLLEGNNWVHAPGPIGCHLKSIHRGVTRLDKQMFDRYKTEKRMAKKFKEDEFRMNRHEYDITALDSAEEPPIHPTSAPRADDPYAMVRDAAMAAREDDDDDTTAPRDPQPSEPRGSLRDPQ
ncbi:hypothetical protein Tco_0484201 [Tanacetum coccineum]